jgi:hypothetical protein
MKHPVKIRRVLYERVFEPDKNGSSAVVRTTEEKTVGDDNWSRRALFQFHSKVETAEGNTITRLFEYKFTSKMAKEIKEAVDELWDHMTNEEPAVRIRQREYEMKIDGGLVFTAKIPPGIETPPSYQLMHSEGGNYSPNDIREFLAGIDLVNTR